MLMQPGQSDPGADFARARHAAAEALRVNAVARPPVVPREIAEAYGLTVELVDLPDDLRGVAGFIDFPSSRILVNSADHYNRQTFTIAHELGHFLLHRRLFEAQPDRYTVLMRQPIGLQSDPLEKEANAFAADLLVPLPFLRHYAKYATIADLAKLFAVSPEVIRHRLRFADRSEPAEAA